MWINGDLALLYLVPSILGMLSEFACFLVFCQIKLGIPLYAYLRAYTINSFLVCCCIFTLFLISVYSLGNSRAIMVFANFFVFILVDSCYLNSNLLDILILLDRISVFNKRVKNFLKLVSIYHPIILLRIVSIILATPYFFLLTTQKISLNVTNGSETTVWFKTKNPISTTQAGYAINMFIITVKYGLMMLIQITLNIISAVYIRRHVKQKATRVRTTQTSNLQNVDVKTGIMVIIQCSVSFLEHLLLTFWTILRFFSISSIDSAKFETLVACSFASRRFCDFFFYLIFNKVFRKQTLIAVSTLKDTRVRSGVSVTQNNRTSL